MTKKIKIRADLQDFVPYQVEAVPYHIKLDANENPVYQNKKLAKHLAKWLRQKENVFRYPDTNAMALRCKLADYYNQSAEVELELTPDQISCGVGSDQLLSNIFTAFIEPGDTVLIPNPSFSMYELGTRIAGGNCHFIELGADFEYLTETYLQAIEQVQPKLVIICNPNNPTGSLMEKSDIIRIVEATEGLVVLDEAYAEFSGRSMIDQIGQYDNLLILRTFSKAYSLAGFRLGYALGTTELIKGIHIVKPPYAIPAISQQAGCYVLDQMEQYRSNIHQIIKRRDKLIRKLSRKPVQAIEQVYPSGGNFILLKIKPDYEPALVEQLHRQQILVRHYQADSRLQHCIRVTIGSKAEMKQLYSILEQQKTKQH